MHESEADDLPAQKHSRIPDNGPDVSISTLLSSGTTEQTQVNFRQQILTRIIEGTGIGQNTEQEIAFQIVCEHAMVESKRQLMLHIAGTGGTGKSYVIDAIVSFFEQIGFRN